MRGSTCRIVKRSNLKEDTKISSGTLFLYEIYCDLVIQQEKRVVDMLRTLREVKKRIYHKDDMYVLSLLGSMLEDLHQFCHEGYNNNTEDHIMSTPRSLDKVLLVHNNSALRLGDEPHTNPPS